MSHHIFTAYLSGNGECFYFAVPLDEALALGIDAELLDPCPHHPDCVAVYPHHLWSGKTALRFEITTTETTYPPPSPVEAFNWLRERFGHLFDEVEL